jgi:RES domain-containing protein
MSSIISTRDELSSSSRHASGRAWRVVEAQHIISTAKLTDNAEEQKLLENLIEDTKPNIPPECRHLNYLLATPFRYGAPYPRGSRFRKAGRTLGVFYGCDNVDTAIAEICFRRLLFFADSAGTAWPREAGEFTAFAAEYATPGAIDLTRPPFDDRAALWMHVTQYDACQALAELARDAGIEGIKYSSARDPRHKLNVALLTCRAFARAEPSERQTWRILFGSNGARALCEMPRDMIDFDRRAFADDPRIAAMRWER